MAHTLDALPPDHSLASLNPLMDTSSLNSECGSFHRWGLFPGNGWTNSHIGQGRKAFIILPFHLKSLTALGPFRRIETTQLQRKKANVLQKKNSKDLSLEGRKGVVGSNPAPQWSMLGVGLWLARNSGYLTNLASSFLTLLNLNIKMYVSLPGLCCSVVES